MIDRKNIRELRPQHRWENEEYRDVEYPDTKGKKEICKSRGKRRAKAYRAGVVFCAGCMGMFLAFFLQSVMMFHWPSVLVSFLVMAIFFAFGFIFDTFSWEEMEEDA